MSGVDYSKWDKMANEMSDSDDDNGDRNKPQVTTFDEPQSVTFGGAPASQAAEGWDDGDSGNNHHDRTTPSSAAAPMDGSRPPVAAEAATVTAASRPKAVLPISDAELAANGAAVSCEASSGGAGEASDADRVSAAGGAIDVGDRLHYVWRQARADVIVVVPAPAGTRAGEVKVSLGTKPDTIAEGVADLIRVSILKGGGLGGEVGGGREVVLLEGELAFQAKLDGEGDADWELKDFPGTVVARGTTLHDASTTSGLEGKGAGAESTHNQGAKTSSSSSSTSSPAAVRDNRGIEIVLRKHCPVPNAAVWWKSLLKGGPEIDVASIQGRSANNHKSVWEEALGMFKEKVAARNTQGKIAVNMGDGD